MRFLFVVHKNEEKAEQNSVLFHRLTLKERGLRPNGYFPLMRQPLVGVDETNIPRTIGQIAVASVENPSGLEQSNGYLYSIGANAGNVLAMQTTSATGTIKSNFLEMSNVDLASDIATMITTQRGYQANTKIITVTDEMLEQLVNMKR